MFFKVNDCETSVVSVTQMEANTQFKVLCEMIIQCLNVTQLTSSDHVLWFVTNLAAQAAKEGVFSETEHGRSKWS